MSRLIPDSFLTIRQAADELTVAMYSGIPEQPRVKTLKEEGYDVADGKAIDDAISKLWTAVDRGNVHPFLLGPKRQTPFKVPAGMTEGIPLLRSARGGDFNFLRPGRRIHCQLVEWFGPDLSQVSVVFRAREIARLARSLLKARRRKAASTNARNVGRPSRQIEVKRIIREIIDLRRWCPKRSLKALTVEVNRRCRNSDPISADTVTRALDALFGEALDRRFERLRRSERRHRNDIATPILR